MQDCSICNALAMEILQSCTNPSIYWLPMLMSIFKCVYLLQNSINRVFLLPWWRHQMETFSALLAICAENSPVPGEFSTQRPVTRSFDVYFDLRPNKGLSKQLWGWWFETQSCPLWRHRNVLHNNVSTFNVIPKSLSIISHYGDVIMGAIASQITSITIVYSTVYSDADQRKHQSSASLAFVREIHRKPVNSPHKWPVNSPHKWSVTRKMIPFDDVIMLKCIFVISHYRRWS